jgi:hypothetical protein
MKIAKRKSTEQVVQIQLEAYNHHDLELFLSVYSPYVTVYDHPCEPIMSGLDEMREHYARLFEQNPDMRAELIQRISMGPYVIDHERITGQGDRGPFETIAIYEVREGLIHQVWYGKL